LWTIVDFDGVNLPDDVTEILSALLAGAREILGDKLAGLYLRGSLAHGGFRAETSDVDVLAVTEAPVGDAELGALAALHARLAALPNTYGNRMEIAYIDRAALRRFRPGLLHPTRGQGATLERSEHHTNWILERWTVREHGLTLFGPNPRTLIDPISSDELQAAVRARLGDWADWARELEDPARGNWKTPHGSRRAEGRRRMWSRRCAARYTLCRVAS
jgi:hypothetical protein